MSDKEKQYEAIVMEIARLSRIIFDGVPENDAKCLAFYINHLVAILADELTISDFHDVISECPITQREYYYNLLYLIDK
jgi:hypothetical protein